MEAETKCCCFDRRQGAIIAGIYSLGLCVLVEALSGYAVYKLQYDDLQAESSNHELFGVSAELLTAYVALAVYGLWLLFSVLLLVGATVRSASLLLPWMIYLLFVCICQCGAIIRYFLLLNVMFSNALYATAFIILIISLIGNLYFFSVVKQFRNDLHRDVSASQENLVNSNLALYKADLRVLNGDAKHAPQMV